MTRTGQMYFDELLLNPSVKAEDEERLSTQANMIFEMLQDGPVTTGELSRKACQYGARILEIRAYLKQYNQTVKMTPGEGGNNKYEIIDLGE